MDFNVTYPVLYKNLTQKSDNHTYWLKFKVENKSDSSLTLHLYCGSIDFVDIFIVSPDFPTEIIKDGTLRPHRSDLSFEEKMAGTLPLNLSARVGRGVREPEAENPEVRLQRHRNI